jgi:hypothetical protein
MFNWLKRKVEMSVAKSHDQDIDRFISFLRGADLQEVSMVVAMATHFRNGLSRSGINVLDPVDADAKDHFIASRLSRLITEVQKDNKPYLAVGLMVWLHTLRAATTPEVRLKGRAMWGELRKGFSGAEDAGETLMELLGMPLNVEDPARIPIGLEPDHR